MTDEYTGPEGNPLDTPPAQDHSEELGTEETQREGGVIPDAEQEVEEALGLPDDKEIEAGKAEEQEDLQRAEEGRPTVREEREQKQSEELAMLRERAKAADQAERQLAEWNAQVQAAAAQVQEQKQLDGHESFEELQEYNPAKAIDIRLQRIEAAEQQRQLQQGFQEVVATVAADEAQYRESDPSYDSRLDSARQARAQSIRQVNPGATEAQVQAKVAEGDRALAAQALRAGVSPAKLAMELVSQMEAGGLQAVDMHAGIRKLQGQPAGQAGQPAQASQQAPAQAPAQAQQAPVANSTVSKPRPPMTSLSAVTGKAGGGRGRKVTASDLANADIDTSEGRALFDAVTGDPAKAQQVDEYGYTYV